MTSTPEQGPSACPVRHAGVSARLFGPDAEQDSKGLYERLRGGHGAVAPVLVPGDLPAWLVLGYREIKTVLASPDRFTSDPRQWRAVLDGQVGPDHPLAPLAHYQPMCNFADGTEHQRLRSAVRSALDSWDSREVGRHVVAAANRLIDRFAPAGRADLVNEFAEQLPMLVMTQLMGMPEQDGPRLVEACRDLMKGTETAVTSNEYVLDALRGLVARKKRRLGDDLASWLLTHESRLSDHEVVEHLRLIIVGANETTSNLIADMLEVVLTDPGARAQLRGGQMALIDALDRVLWDSPPLSVLPARYAVEDTSLGGQAVRRGDMVLLGLAAGNADPAIRPDAAKSMAGNRAHLAFGAGPHACPGLDIGRSIADTGIDELLRRLPDLWLADEEAERPRTPTWTSSHLVGLEVTFAPSPPAGDRVSGGAALEGPGPEAPALERAPARALPQRGSGWSELVRRMRRQ
ncbi:cytochrome P450 [Kitasatospora sp. NPDC048540]|uniref:cytochrome P450 n=1 Tax=Kitasatospora sp. NPDC048540 TaxID=3155634 RepID=UPI003407B7DC